jgi:Cu/Ag efflux pump CusA
MAETEYMVRASGYLKTLEDFRQIPLRTNSLGVPVTLEMLQRFNSDLKCVVVSLN